jgi:hypothetical protein
MLGPAARESDSDTDPSCTSIRVVQVVTDSSLILVQTKRDKLIISIPRSTVQSSRHGTRGGDGRTASPLEQHLGHLLHHETLRACLAELQLKKTVLRAVDPHSFTME